MTTTQPLFKVTYLNTNGRPFGDCTPGIIDAAEARDRLSRPRVFRFRLEPVAIAPAKPARAAAALKAVRRLVNERSERTDRGMLFTPAEKKRLDKIQSRLRDIRFVISRVGSNGKRCRMLEIGNAGSAATFLRYPRVDAKPERYHAEPVAIVPLPIRQRREAMRLLKAAA